MTIVHDALRTHAAGARSPSVDPRSGLEYVQRINSLWNQMFLFDLESRRSPDVDVLADRLAGTAPIDLLGRLSDDFDLPWISIAKYLGVSVTAVNKWRAGGPVSESRNYALRALVAFLEVVEQYRQDPAGWLSSEPLPGIPFTRGDLYLAGGRDVLARDLVRQIDSPRHLLDQIVPGWDEVYEHTGGLARVWFDRVDEIWIGEIETLGLVIDGSSEQDVEEVLIDMAQRVAQQELPTGASEEVARRVRESSGDALRKLLFG